MNIVFITIEMPSLKKGAPVRVYNLIKQAVLNGAVVDVITLVEANEDAEHLKDALGVRTVIGVQRKHSSPLSHVYGALIARVPPYFVDYRASGLSETVVRHVEKVNPDIVQLELLHSYYAVAPALPAIKRSGAKIILDAHNVEHLVFKQTLATFPPLKRLLGTYMAPKLRSREVGAAQTTDHIFTCSETDRMFFAQASTERKTSIIPNGVDCELFGEMPLVKEPVLLFAGSSQYPPNEDALRFYFDAIHPEVKKAVPDVTVYLLGGEPVSWLKRYAAKDPSIVIPGLVPDVREYYRKARVCIAPIRTGSGTSLKFLEYLGSGKPTVATTIGARGIACTDGKDVLLADGARTFTAAVVRLLRDDSLAIEIGKMARATMVHTYDWRIIGKNMHATYTTVAKPL